MKGGGRCLGERKAAWRQEEAFGVPAIKEDKKQSRINEKEAFYRFFH